MKSDSIEIYIKDQDGILREVTLIDLINQSAKDAKLKTKLGMWTDTNERWLEIYQRSKLSGRKKRIAVSYQFDTKGNQLKSLSVFSTPIKTVVDEDNTKKLV